MAGTRERQAVEELYAAVEDREQALRKLGDQFVSKGGQVFRRVEFERSEEQLREQVNQYDEILRQRLGR